MFSAGEMFVRRIVDTKIEVRGLVFSPCGHGWYIEDLGARRPNCSFWRSVSGPGRYDVELVKGDGTGWEPPPDKTAPVDSHPAGRE